MCHTARSLHQLIGHVALKNIRHALAAGYFMGKDGGGTFIRRASHFARPHGNAVAHAARHKLEPQVSPVGVKCWLVETRLAVEAVEIGTDELAVFHANASVVDEIRYATGGVNLIVSASRGSRFCLNDLDAL